MSDDNSFSTFMFGLTIGIVGTILLGTEEGRKVSQKLLQSAGETLEKNEDLFQEAKAEPPPSPPPFTNRPRPKTNYFESHGTLLD